MPTPTEILTKEITSLKTFQKFMLRHKDDFIGFRVTYTKSSASYLLEIDMIGEIFSLIVTGIVLNDKIIRDVFIDRILAIINNIKAGRQDATGDIQHVKKQVTSSQRLRLEKLT